MFKRARPKPEKHLPYFQFVKGMKAGACPVCGAGPLLPGRLVRESPVRERQRPPPQASIRRANRPVRAPRPPPLRLERRPRGRHRLPQRPRAARWPRFGKGKQPAPQRGATASPATTRPTPRRATRASSPTSWTRSEMRAGLEASSGLCMPHFAAVMASRRRAPRPGSSSSTARPATDCSRCSCATSTARSSPPRPGKRRSASRTRWRGRGSLPC